MPLTHVCMWSEHGWKRVTAEKAVRSGASGTVSARSGLFMCELCGQYVTLAYGMIRDPYFKHSSEELSKDCLERTFSTSAYTTFQAGSHGLPLRIRILSPSQFELQLGLLPVPQGLLNENRIISISSPGSSSLNYRYSTSRIEEGTISYLSVGSSPVPNYQLTIAPHDSTLSSYWPRNVEGISRSGTLFDSATGKKLPSDADTIVQHKYWLLISHPIYRKYQDVSIKQICRYAAGFSSWYVYEVVATAFQEDAARFFLDYHCRLTENAIAITPLWPVYVQTPYVIKHFSDHLTVFLRGDASPKVFPITYLQSFSCDDGKVLFVNCKERQQILSAGRTKVLRYTYLWKDPLEMSVPVPSVEVTDYSGEVVSSGEQVVLPKKRMIVVTAPFDGFALVKKKNALIDRIQISSEKRAVIDKLQVGYSVEIFQGADLAWSAKYIRTTSNATESDALLVQKLRQCNENEIPITHSLGAVAARLHDYPLTKRWLYQCVRKGKMPERAYKTLIKHFAVKGQ